MMKKILFDVGANDGSKWFTTLEADQDNTFVFMFEPTPYLCGIITEKYKHLKNWTLIQKAVSDYEGVSQFNIAGHGDWGCSSLMTFREERLQTWPSNRTDLNFTDSVEVEVVTLERFLKDNPTITKIDYLHVDAQGSDLNVLKGLRSFINIVKQGAIEAAYNAPLYNGSPTHTECIQWLEEKGFTTEVHNANHECDIAFINTTFSILMVLISHRGNTDGKFKSWENEPTYIDKAMRQGFDVEVDMWYRDGILSLGHDRPQYTINQQWLQDRINNLWIHCKNIEAIEYFTTTLRDPYNYFWHEEDTITLTSCKFIWAYPGKQPIKNSIAVMPELYDDDITQCLGICSDYIKKYKK